MGALQLKMKQPILGLFAASILAGAVLRYGIVSDGSVFGCIFAPIMSMFMNVSGSCGVNLNDSMIALLMLPIIVAPILFAFAFGKWGLITALVGYLCGFCIADGFLANAALPLVLGIVLIIPGALIAKVGQASRP
jgi:hypothetical protein